MTNQELAKIFYEIALYLEMQDVAFKPQAYEKAAASIESLADDVGKIYEKEESAGLRKIPFVGQGLAEKIEEYLKTGKIKEYLELKKKTPVEIGELTGVEGVGPKTVRDLYKLLKIKNLKELEAAAKAGKIRDLPRFGLKKEQNILESIEFLKKTGGRFLLGDIFPIVGEIEEKLKSLKEVKKISPAGSLRRMKETIGDVDFLVISDNPEKVMDYFVSLPGVVKIWGKGKTKASVRMEMGFDMDIRVVPEKSYGSALQYFTGSKEHNIALRRIAIGKGLKLSEYGLFKGGSAGWRLIAGKTEEEIYEKLGMDYIEPEMRENTGEIELSQKHRLPKLINYGEIKGDLQIQTDWSDGANSIEECAEEAMRLGLEYIVITDHSKRLAVAHGLDEKRLLEQMKEIDKINAKLQAKSAGRRKKFRVLKGTECDILKDGSLDLADEILEKLEVVGAAIHSHFDLPKAEQTKRLIRAMENKNVDIIFHPTGRIINRRKPYEIDIDAIIKTAKRTGTVLEIDAYPNRLDLKDEHVKKCVEAGVKLSIDSDAHSASHMAYLNFGVSQARRGWAEKSDIINCWPVEKMLKMLK